MGPTGTCRTPGGRSHGQTVLGEAVALSAQEHRIAQLAAAGHTTKEIAARVNLSPRTVDSHLNRAFRKLGVTRRSALNDALSEYDRTVTETL